MYLRGSKYNLYALAHDQKCLTLKVPKMKIFQFANSVDPDDAAHNESSHPDSHTLCPPVFKLHW